MDGARMPLPLLFSVLRCGVLGMAPDAIMGRGSTLGCPEAVPAQRPGFRCAHAVRG